MTYNSNFNGGVYNGFDPLGQAERYNAEQKEKRRLRKLGNISGIALVLFVAFQFLGAFLLIALNLYDDYVQSTDRGYAIGTLMSIFCIFLPFFISSFLLKGERQKCLNFGKPYDTRLMLLAVPIGLMICMVGNYATSFISNLVEISTGITFESPDSPTPTSPLGIFCYILQIAVVPALVEEYAIRGVVMMPARKYGEWFAILSSAAIFGIMHGNLVQAPFAFIVGIGIGYLVIVTGSMWTGVMIHFCNNLFSALISISYEFLPESAINIIFYSCVIIFVVAGIVCSLLFLCRAKCKRVPVKFKKPQTLLTKGQRTVAYFVNIPMILALIYLLYTTSQYITWPW